MIASIRRALYCCLGWMFFLFLPGHGQHAGATTTEKIVEKPFREAVTTEQRTQRNEEEWRKEQEILRLRFDELEKKRALFLARKKTLTGVLAASEQRLAEKRTRQEEMLRINKEIAPFLDRLLAELRQTQSESLPFLTTERRQRMEKLEQLFADPAVTLAERYRRLMEALLIEAEYGFTTEITQETINLAGQDRLVEIFRLGRLNLFYLTLDQRQCGFYNEVEKKWQALDDRYLRSVRNAVEISAKRRPVELISLPVGALQAGVGAGS